MMIIRCSMNTNVIQGNGFESEASLAQVEIPALNLPAVRSWTNYLNPLCLGFLICEI